MSSRFGKKWSFGVLATLLLMSLAPTAQAQFGPANIQQVGGVWINPSGVLSHVTEPMRQSAQQLMQQALSRPEGTLAETSQLRMISLRYLERALAEAAEKGNELSDEVKYMAGIQRLQYVFVDPENNDLILAGPGEAWVADRQGNIVGATTGRPVIRFEDFIVAMRTADNANKDYGISVSIDPTEEGQRRYQALNATFKRRGTPQDIPTLRELAEQAMGPQDISLTGLPTDTRFAQILAAADYRMKRLGMGFEPAPIEGLPSMLEIALERGRAVELDPRLWLECSYGPVRQSEDGLAWQLQGPGAKALIESKVTDAKGRTKTVKDHPVAKQWVENMTEKFAELADADPVFAELQNIMDQAVISALIRKHNLLSKANLELPTISGVDGNVKLPKWSVPKTVPSQCSFVQIKNNLVMTISGGVQVDSWAVLDQIQIDNAIAQVRSRAGLGSDQPYWNATR